MVYIAESRQFPNTLILIIRLMTSRKYSSDANNPLILGLDLGTASVGWALVSEQNGEKIFLDAGVKIFHEPVEPKSWNPKNRARREARGARRNLERKVRRKRALRITLEQAGLQLPENFHKNLYELRTKALDHRLEKDELAAVLYHFGQKRGFLSNAKTPTKEDGVVKTTISTIEQKMQEFGARTLGEYRYFLMQSREKQGLRPQKFEETYTSRDMYKSEFVHIWDKQAEFYGDILTPELKNDIFHFLFSQRPLKLQKGLVGSCTYFPARKRAERASLIAQEFLVWKQVSDMKYRLPGQSDFVDISWEDKKKFAEILMQQWSINFQRTKKLLWLPEDAQLNFEKGNETKFIGNKTTTLLNKFLGAEENFENGTIFMPENASMSDVIALLVQDILTIHVDEYLAKRLKNFWKISKQWVQNLLNLKLSRLPKGYIRYSEKALRKILPMMKETGKNDRLIIEELQQAGKFPQERNRYKNSKDVWQMIPQLRNPSVTKAIIEARKVLKAIMKTYGTPTCIRIEMVGDLKNSNKKRRDIQKRQNVQKKLNDEAKAFIAELGQDANKRNILLYKLHKECDGTCPYTGRKISLRALLEGNSEFDIEHIIPRSRSLDDSFANKTLCYKPFNQDIKKNKIPQELKNANFTRYGSEQNWSFDAMMQFAKRHLGRKESKFSRQSAEIEGFIAHQLNDTSYISQEVKQICEALIGKEAVEITKGNLTSTVRHAWGFDGYFKTDTPPEENTKNTKKNRSDHRHHAVDAIVIALTDRSMLQKASRESAKNERAYYDRDESKQKNAEIFKPLHPGDAFVQAMEAKLENMIVSHTPAHKIHGSLHDDSAWGKIFDRESQKEVFAIRKDISSDFWLKDCDDIIDAEVRKILKKYFREHTVFDPNNPPLHKDEKTPILHVRIKASKANMYNFRDEDKTFFVYGNIHHVEIIEHKTRKKKDGSPKREGIFVTMWEANRRAKNHEPIINRWWPWHHSIKEIDFDASEWNFVNSLSGNDLVKYTPNPEHPEVYEICRIQKLWLAGSQLFLTAHTQALVDKFFSVSPSGYHKIQKIQIDALGNIFPARD